MWTEDKVWIFKMTSMLPKLTYHSKFLSTRLQDRGSRTTAIGSIGTAEIPAKLLISQEAASLVTAFHQLAMNQTILFNAHPYFVAVYLFPSSQTTTESLYCEPRLADSFDVVSTRQAHNKVAGVRQSPRFCYGLRK